MIQERFFRLREVQAMLSISRSTLWRWHAERGLKVVRIGDVTRIRESDLQAFLSCHESEKPLQSVKTELDTTSRL